jgi:hypothetical protein
MTFYAGISFKARPIASINTSKWHNLAANAVFTPIL